MNSFLDITKSLIKNLKKGKFYSVFRFFLDSKYREDILYLKALTTRSEMVLGHGAVPLRSIIPGHAINYPDWTQRLVNQINAEGWKSIEPVKVVWDPDKLVWIVVDGNHRLEALKRCIPGYVKIPVFILMPKGMDQYRYMEKLISSLLTNKKRSQFKVSGNTTWH